MDIYKVINDCSFYYFLENFYFSLSDFLSLNVSLSLGFPPNNAPSFLYDELLINNSMKITKINLNLDDIMY